MKRRPSNPNKQLSETVDLINSIDWELLRTQKQWLLKRPESNKIAAGLVNLIDSLQDLAVDHFAVDDAMFREVG